MQMIQVIHHTYSQIDKGDDYMTMLHMNTETFVFVYIEAMRHLYQYVFTENGAHYCDY